MSEKVTLRELLGKQPKFYLYRTDDKTTIINAYKSLDKYIGELTAEVKAFLEPSPQTLSTAKYCQVQEIRELLENLREKIAEALKYASLPKKKAVSALLDEALPKLEAFLADHVSREEVTKLQNDVQDIKEKVEQGKLTWNFKDVANLLGGVSERLELLTKKGDSPQ